MTNTPRSPFHATHCRCADCIDAENRVVSVPAPVGAGSHPVAYYNDNWTLTPRAYAEAMRRNPASFADLKPAYAAPATNGAPDVSNLVPGQMHCARCKFQLTRTNLYVGSGTVGAGDSKTEPCPNGCGPLWPVTWEQATRDAWATCETLFERAKAAEDALAAVNPPQLVAAPSAVIAAREQAAGASEGGA